MLSKNEILEGYEKFYGQTLSKEDVFKIFDSVDIDKSGFINFTEFVMASMNEKEFLSDEKLLSTFKNFDKSGSGTIKTTEIKELLAFGKIIIDEVIVEVVKQVDANGDGEISFEEFAQMMKKHSV